MKNYFIANGEVLNTNMSIEEMELRVQATLDESTSGMAQFKIKVNLESFLQKMDLMFPLQEAINIQRMLLKMHLYLDGQ